MTGNQKQSQKPKKKKMDRHKLLVSILAALMALLMLLPVLTMVFGGASAVSVSEIEQQIKTLKGKGADFASQKEGYKAQLEKIKGDKSRAVEQKSILEQQINVIQSEIENLSGQIGDYDTLIAEKKTEISVAKDKEADQYETFCQRVRAMEEEGTVSYWSILLAADNFSDLLDRVNFISEVMEYDNALMDQLAATRADLETAEADLTATQTELKATKESQEGARAELKDKEASVEGLLADIRSQQVDAEAALAAAQAAAAEMDAQIAKKEKEREAEIARKAAEHKVQFNTGGSYVWPLPSSCLSITSFAGPRTHPLTGVYHNHTGTDIAAPGGTPIFAAHGGMVLTSGYNGSYGNYVVLSRGDGVSTLYAHMSRRAVSEGDVVSAGQTIGYVGSTGSSTGNHLHFEFRVNGARLNGLNYYPGVPYVDCT